MKAKKFFSHHVAGIAAGLLIVALMLLNTIGLVRLGFVDRLENATYDLRLRWSTANTIDPRIVIVDIDEKSLLQQGRWPWPRNKLASLVNKLFDGYKVKALGFDVIFSEPDESSGLRSLEQMRQGVLRNNRPFSETLDALRPQLQFDAQFAASMKNRPVVLGYYFSHGIDEHTNVGALPTAALPAGSFEATAVGAAIAGGYTANLPELQQSATTAGFFNVSPFVGNDGVLRRMSMLQMHDGALYESLGLALARLALNAPPVHLAYSETQASSISLEAIDIGRWHIPVDQDMAALLPFRGRQGSFAYVSAADVLSGKADANVLRDAIILVGTSAPGLMDLRVVPVQDTYPGVEVHANLIAGIMDGNIKSRPAYTVALEFILLLLIGVVLAFSLPLLAPIWATLLTALSLVTTIAINLYLWRVHNLVVPLASGLFMIAALFVLDMSYGFFVNSRAKRLISNLFGQYVPPELVEEMAQNPSAYTVKGESRELTVLFADIRGFTTLSEGLSPTQLTEMINHYLTPMTRVIYQHRGTVDKYIGDAIMAFWGAPVADAQHPTHALEAAMGMVSELHKLQDSFRKKGWPTIQIGIGVNTGVMTVGNMGSAYRLAYTVMGDAVNLASRLEGLTKYYGVAMIVSESTQVNCPEFAYRELDRVRVKGKDKPITIYEPIALSTQLTPAQKQLLADEAHALALYRAGQWQNAADAFGQLVQSESTHPLYTIYLERIATYASSPPPQGWDGVYNFQSK